MLSSVLENLYVVRTPTQGFITAESQAAFCVVADAFLQAHWHGAA